MNALTLIVLFLFRFSCTVVIFFSSYRIFYGADGVESRDTTTVLLLLSFYSLEIRIAEKIRLRLSLANRPLKRLGLHFGTVQNTRFLKIKSSLHSRYYSEACNEWWGPSPRL